MLRNLFGPIAIAALLLSATATIAAPAHGKRHVARHWHGYGFLPGYRSPERIEAEQARARGPVYWYGGPGFYRGRFRASFSARIERVGFCDACGQITSTSLS